MSPRSTKYEEIAIKIGQLVDKKNAQYGDSINTTGKFLRLLYPSGISPEQYADLGILIRLWDKIKRVVHGNKGDENAYKDIAGYGILMCATTEVNTKTAEEGLVKKVVSEKVSIPKSDESNEGYKDKNCMNCRHSGTVDSYNGIYFGEPCSSCYYHNLWESKSFLIDAYRKAISTIKANYPDGSGFTSLKESLDIALKAMDDEVHHFDSEKIEADRELRQAVNSEIESYGGHKHES